MLTMIKKKTRQRVVASIGRDWVSSLSRFCILISMTILCPLIDIDTRIKIIYIDSSHIKLLRCFLNIKFLHIYKNNLSLRSKLIAINISNLFLTFKHVKYYRLGQNLISTLMNFYGKCTVLLELIMCP